MLYIVKFLHYNIILFYLRTRLINQTIFTPVKACSCRCLLITTTRRNTYRQVSALDFCYCKQRTHQTVTRSKWSRSLIQYDLKRKLKSYKNHEKNYPFQQQNDNIVVYIPRLTLLYLYFITLNIYINIFCNCINFTYYTT